jgi:hypothetical protein
MYIYICIPILLAWYRGGGGGVLDVISTHLYLKSQGDVVNCKSQAMTEPILASSIVSSIISCH